MSSVQLKPSDRIKQVDPVWDAVRANAKGVVADEPALAAMVMAHVLNQPNFESALISRLSERLGLISSGTTDRIVSVLTRARLPVKPPALGYERYLELMGHDKKVEGGKLRFILLRAIGDAFVTDEVRTADLRQVLDAA